jgi:hypothetical protein
VKTNAEKFEVNLMQKIYAVVVEPQYAQPSVSQEAYTSLDKAQSFVELRGDKPVKQTDFYYIGRKYSYYIKELSVC